MYEYYPHLQEKKYVENFMRWNDIFAGRLVHEFQGNINKRLTTEVMEFITIYGSYFIQFPQFTYIRVGSFEGEPFRLSQFVLDSYVLIEVCRQLSTLR